MSAVQEVVTEAPAIEAVPKRAMTLGYGTSLIILGLLILAPMFVKHFITFQLTMLLIYGLAVLALNILTGGSGQFSLGQSAFYAVGAYTSAILMEHAGMNYALTLPISGIICFGFGFLFGQPALRLSAPPSVASMILRSLCAKSRSNCWRYVNSRSSVYIGRPC